MPAAVKLAITAASRPGVLAASASEPAVVGMAPATSMLSLMRMGMPSNELLRLPAARRASDARAASSARGSKANTA